LPNTIKDFFTRSISRVKSKKTAILVLTDQGIVSLCNFLTIFILARLLPTEVFGLFILVYTALLLLTSLQHAAITQAHNVLGARLEGAAYQEFNSVIVTLQLLFAIIILCLLFIIAFIARQFQLESLVTGILGLGIVLFPWLIRDLIRKVLYTQLRVKASLLNDAVSYGLQLAGIIVLTRHPAGVDIILIFLVMGSSSAVAIGFGVVQLRATISFREMTVVSFQQTVGEIWIFSRWLSTGQLLSWLGKYGHSWIIAALWGVGPLAGYRAATHLSNILNPISIACSSYLTPKASRIYAGKGHSSLMRWLRSRVFVLGAVYLSISISIIVFARPLLDFFYDGKYSSTQLILVLGLTVVSRIIGYISSLLNITLAVLEKTYALFMENVIALVFVGTVSLVMIKSMGIVGAPVARILLSVILAIYGYAIVASIHPKTSIVKASHTFRLNN
jgi:O-antigen/teichoic acid export membrane protein